MKIRNEILFLVVYILGFLKCYSQDRPANYIKTDRLFTVTIPHEDYKCLQDSSNLRLLFQTLFSMNITRDSTLRLLFPAFADSLKDGLDLPEGYAVVLVRYSKSRINPQVTNYEKLNPVAISKDKNKYSSYILNKRHILLVFLDYSVWADNIKVDNKTSYFSNSLSGIIKILKETYLGGGQTKDADPKNILQIRFVYLESKKIVPPSEISFAVPVREKGDKQDSFRITDDTPFDTTKVTVHERNHFSFSVGLNGSFLNKQNFKLSGDTVSVSLDSAQKKQLSNSITLSLEWYPFGRDIDQFLPLWKDWKNITQHLGISAGISLSKDPLQSYYVGMALCLTKEFNVVAGVNFANTTKNNQYQITNIISISDLSKYVLGRSYQGSFYIGISLSPSQAIKNLGL